MIATNDVLAGEPVDLGSPAADRSDPDAMIYPFKKMIGNQIADAAQPILDPQILVPHLFGLLGGHNPYWVDYDWDPALWDAIDYPTGADLQRRHISLSKQRCCSRSTTRSHPKEQSLGADNDCSDCHGQGPDGVDLIDWPALGWDEDPYKEKQKGKEQVRMSGRVPHLPGARTRSHG